MGYAGPPSRDAYPLQGKWDGWRRWLCIGGWGKWSELTAFELAELKRKHVRKSASRSA